MPRLLRAKTRRLLTIAAVMLAAIGLGLVLTAWSGVYNIAASRGHWTVVEWFLEFGMRNSVKRRAWMIEAPPLDAPDLATLGAAHFHRSCAHCHGAPGVAGDPVARQALPPPPDLTHVSREWNTRELFWIVKNGIKYTGMPAWPAQERDDEVWAVVAFLQRLPQLDAASYRALVLGAADTPPRNGRDLATTGAATDAISACARCHGAEQRGPTSALVPVLHGQPAEFIADALRAYASGSRASGIMLPLASELDADAIKKLVDYYAGLPAPQRTTGSEVAGHAQVLATRGDPAARIPACNACHGAEALPAYPRLAGQNAAYMANRLRLWKRGVAGRSETEAIMAPIARLLSDAQISGLAEYYAAQPATRSGGTAAR